MRKINYIAIHCTATPATTTVESILRYWKNNLGWKTVGYHYLIKADGEIVKLLDESKPSNGVAGFNSQTVNVSYIGGIDENKKPKDTRTEAQKTALIKIVGELKSRYPDTEILGHRDFPNVKKACPCFDVKKQLMTF
jgi:N-acetylmuramoyl-L-alanine amidase